MVQQVALGRQLGEERGDGLIRFFYGAQNKPFTPDYVFKKKCYNTPPK